VFQGLPRVRRPRSSRPGGRVRARFVRRLAVIAGAVVLATIAVSLPLAAAPPAASTTSGATAACMVAAVAPTMVRITCTLTDASRDGDSVYVAWRTTSGGERTLYNRSGYGHAATVTADAPTAQVAPPHRVLWRVCRNRQVPWLDNCSGWRSEWAALAVA
jgi:hypothetical protein